MPIPIHRHMTAPCLALLALGCAATASAAGREALELPPLTVQTATRTEREFDDSLASARVITREDIQRSAAEDLPELLRLEAGVDIVRTGPAGAQTSVFLRGGNSNHVLVLIDGIRVASAHTGTYAWELLPLAQIERIEIVRGPRAALYGSDAISGVIQVFTRRLEAPQAKVTLGSLGTSEWEAGAGFSSARGRHSVHAAHRRTDGFSAQNPRGFSYDPDRDGLRSSSAGISGEIGAPASRWSYRLLGSDTESEFDQGVSTASQRLAALRWEKAIRPDWRSSLQASWLDDELESDFGFFTTRFTSRRQELSWSNQFQRPRGAWVFGAELLHESGRSAGSYDANRDNRAVFAFWDAPAGAVHWQFGGRWDDNSEFGAEATWQAAAALTAGQQGQVVLSAGTSFRAPGLGEQFSPGFGGLFAGNPSLEPETGRSLELGYRVRFERDMRLRLAAFDARIDDLIAFSGPNFQAVNVNRARLSGLELEWQAQRGPWSLDATATLQTAENAETGEDLLRRPRRKAGVALNRAVGRGWIGLDGFFSGPRADVGGVTLPGYAILGLRAGWAASEVLTLALRLENVLDKDHEPAAGFDGGGRAIFGSVTWRR